MNIPVLIKKKTKLVIPVVALAFNKLLTDYTF